MARRFARDGAALHLVARNEQKLELLKNQLPGASRVTTSLADFTSSGSLGALVQSIFDELGRIDVVFLAHGDLPDQLATERSFDAAQATIQLNFLSAVELTLAIANRMEEQRSGVIGVITSVAGQRGRPRNYTYGAAKGALTIYLQGLRSRLFRKRVRVVTILLGPVDTPMTVSHEKNWTFSTKEDAGRQIYRALLTKNGDVYVPGFFRWIILIVRLLPERIFQSLSSISGR